MSELNLMLPQHLPSLKMLQREQKRRPEINPLAMFTLNELLRVSKRVLALVEIDLLRHGLSRGRATTLWIIASRGTEGITPAEISSELDVTRATMTGLLDLIERDGLIVRERSTDDRRNVIVRISAKGLEQMSKLSPDHLLRCEEAMSVLSDAEKKQLLALLKRVEHGAEAFARPEPPRRRHTTVNGQEGRGRRRTATG